MLLTPCNAKTCSYPGHRGHQGFDRGSFEYRVVVLANSNERWLLLQLSHMRDYFTHQTYETSSKRRRRYGSYLPANKTYPCSKKTNAKFTLPSFQRETFLVVKEQFHV